MFFKYIFSKFFLVAVVIFLSIFLANSAHAKIHIIVTNSYLKNLITAIGKDKIEIDSLMSGGSCAHHYSLKPTELEKIINTDLLIYLDKKYEPFIDKIIPLIKNSKILEISSIKNINIKYNNAAMPLWYLWYDLRNVELILSEIASILSTISPNDTEYFKANYKENLEHVSVLKQDLETSIGFINKAIVIDDRLSYIFLDSDNIKQLFFHSHSLKFSDLLLLKKLTTEASHDKQNTNICVFVTPEYRSRIMNNIRNDIKIIDIDLNNNTSWHKQFHGIIKQISTCRN